MLVTTLTKRMAEDLTDYLHEHGVQACATCTPTSRRSSASRSSATCGSASSTCWSASTCCAKGSTCPEVSLVAILDADKEGFLRSEGSLIQTIGRAARNVRGKAILYADRMTGSMQRAIDETNRRRTKQVEYNEQHGIEPPRSARRSRTSWKARAACRPRSGSRASSCA